MASFPMGTPSKCFFDSDSSERLKWSAYRNTDTRRAKKKQIVVTGENDVVEFTGRNFGSDSLAPKMCKYIVGVVGEGKSTMAVYDAVPVAMMQRVKRSKIDDEEIAKENDAAASENASRMQAVHALTERFGGKKSKTAIKATQEGRVDAEALAHVKGLVQQRMQEKMANAPALHDIQTEMAAERPLPPCNPESRVQSECFPFDQLLPNSDMDLLRQPGKQLASANAETIDQWRKEERYGNFVLNHIPAIPKDPPALKNKMSRTLIYIHYLHTFLSCANRDGNKTDPWLAEIPQPVLGRFYSLFADPDKSNDDSYIVTPRNQDRVRAYIVALGLHITGFTLDYRSLMVDFRLEQPTMRRLLQGMGLHIHGTHVTLKAPLAFRDVSLRRVGRSK